MCPQKLPLGLTMQLGIPAPWKPARAPWATEGETQAAPREQPWAVAPGAPPGPLRDEDEDGMPALEPGSPVPQPALPFLQPPPAAPKMPSTDSDEEGPDHYAPGPHAHQDRTPSKSEFIAKPRAIRAQRDRPSPPRRLGRSVYDAIETHGHFGLVDTGEVTQGSRIVILHVPRKSGGYTLDSIHPGDTIHTNRATGGIGRGAALTVTFVTRNAYFRPGVRVSSCVVGVPEHEWRAFMRE